MEEYCRFFPYITDFKQLYKYLEIVNEEIIHFALFTSTFGSLKSDYNYIRSIFSKLTHIKYLELVFTKSANIKLLKNLVKGIANSLKEKAAIEHLKIITNPNCYNYSQKDLNVLTILDNLPSLKILDVHNNTLSGNVPPGMINLLLHLFNFIDFYPFLFFFW
jgi:hypothetical protein